MRGSIRAGRGFLAALFAAAIFVGSVQAQSSGSSTPYWGTSPQSYSGSQLHIPVPSISPSMLSNASRSGPTASSIGSGIGGGYLPPSITSLDLRLPRTQQGGDDNTAHIWLHVPENADVWVAGIKTKQTGETRYYYSPPLPPGKKYSYQMRVRWIKDGKPVETTQQIIVQAGETIRRDFTRPPAATRQRRE